MSTQTPTLAEIFDRAVHERLRESFGGWLPARIESYDADTNRATVQVLLLDDYEDEEGVRRTEYFPPIDDVPVCWLSLGGKFVLRSTVSAGDEGIYMSPARPTGRWLQTGGIVDPADQDQHPFEGGVFLPYRVSAGGGNQDPLIEITTSEIRAGGDKGLAFNADLNALKLAFDTHVHTAAGAPTSLPAAVEPMPSPLPGGYAGTSKLKGG